jgi:DNA-binding LacI/PurR family transcriptional regulator
MSGARSVTIEDVAARAGVSLATVSRALRGLPNVAPSTRARVLEVAEELKYRPDPHASRLAAGRTRTVGIAVPLPGEWYFSQVVAGAHAVLSSAGYDLLVYGAESVDDRRRFVADATSVQQRVDGLILVDMPAPAAEVEAWAEQGARLVTVGQRTEHFPSVTIDNPKAASVAVHHLLDLGHQRIGLISGGEDAPLYFTVPNERHAAYEAALRGRKIEARDEWCADGNFSMEGGREAMSALLAATEIPTAVFAISDEMAMGAISSARDHGLLVPDHLSVIGFDDHDLAAAFALTTVRQPVVEMGERAARMLLDSLEDDRPPQHYVAPTSLVVRSTTARRIRD